MREPSKLRLNEKIRYKLAQTPAGECWLCAELSEKVKYDEQGPYIFISDLNPADFGHLMQVIEATKE